MFVFCLTADSVNKTKLGPRANSTDRVTAACRPTFADRGYYVVSVTDPYGTNLGPSAALSNTNPT
jgi:hypothetical protein